MVGSVHMVVTSCIAAQTSQKARKTDHGKVRNACGSARGQTVRGRFGVPRQQASLAQREIMFVRQICSDMGVELHGRLVAQALLDKSTFWNHAQGVLI